MNPPQNNDGYPVMPQFKPAEGQWELNDENIKRIDPENGHTILHNYCKYINSTPVEVFKYLIEVKDCSVNLPNNRNDTPVHIGFRKFNPHVGGDVAVLSYFLGQENINVNTKGRNGRTLLHWACFRINSLPSHIFMNLIEVKGADINLLDEFKNTPLYYALHLFKLNCGGNTSTLTYLLSQRDLNANIIGQNGCILLHVACENINTLPSDVFRVLIEIKGSDVNALDRKNNTPLYYAISSFESDNGNIAVLTYLLDRTDVNCINRQNGRTPLHSACFRICQLPLDIFKHLIEVNGCDVNLQDVDKNTPLFYAIHYLRSGRGLAVLNFLLKNNINFNLIDRSRRSLLHLPCAVDLSGSRGGWAIGDTFWLPQAPLIGDEAKGEADTFWSQIVENVIEGYLQQSFDETRS
jgi:ankyrin repeat protein